MGCDDMRARVELTIVLQCLLWLVRSGMFDKDSVSSSEYQIKVPVKV